MDLEVTLEPTLEKAAQSMLDSDSTLDIGDADEAPLIILELDEPNGEDLVFTLPNVPGADDQSEIVLEDESPAADIEVSNEPGDVEVSEPDAWDWHAKGPGNFLTWLKSMIEGVPRHTGRDTTGLEKAISYFEALDREISKAMRVDYKNEIDSAKAEQARQEIESGLERLVERLEKVRTSKFTRHKKKSKKASSDEQSDDLVKEAQKATHVGGISVTVPLLISTLARICINGTVSGGHNLEEMFESLSEKYKLTDREKLELVQLLMDMGYYCRIDRGLLGDKDVDTTSSNNFDWAANFPG